MKFCILTPRFPFPENGGDVLRINNVARYLKSQGHSICLVSFAQREPDVIQALQLYDSVYCVPQNRLLSYFFSFVYFLIGKPMQCGFYHSRSFLRVLQQVIESEHPDQYVAHLLRMTPYLERLGLQSQSIVEMTDALSKTYALAVRSKEGGVMKWIYKFECKRIKQYELQIVGRFPKVVLVSQKDVDYLQELCPQSKSLRCYSNGVECRSTMPKSYNANKICFVGNMRTLQNQDAVLDFVKNIFPLILQKRPNAMFYIVGAEPPSKIQNLASDHIVVTGFVSDVQTAIQDSCVMVAPVRVASGIQNKVLNALGCGVPVVLTSLIAQAIPELKDKENCLIANQSKTICEAVLSIMNDSQFRNNLGSAGYQMVKDYYSWNKRLQDYDK